MSMQEAQERGLALIPKWWTVASVIAGSLLSMGATWGVFSWRLDALEQFKARHEGVSERLYDRLNEVNERLSRIEGKLER